MAASVARDFADGRWIVDSARAYLGNLERALPIIMSKLESNVGDQPIKLELEPRQGFLVFVSFQPAAGWRIRIPEGLVLRLIAVLRLLIAYWGRPPAARFLNSPLDAIDEGTFWTPPRIAPIFEEADGLTALSAALDAMEFTQPLPLPAYWEDIESMANQALLFVICHEIAHATDRHLELRERAEAGELVKEFGLTVDDVRLCTEMVADIQGTYNFTFMTLVEAATTPEDEHMFSRLATRAGFAIPALLGLWDHHKKCLAAYKATEYPSSMVRSQLFSQSAPKVLDGNPERLAIWRQAELTSWTSCVHAFGHVTIDLMLLGEAKPPPGKLFWPIGSLNYGGHFSMMGIEKDIDRKMALLEKFRAWDEAVKPSLPALH